MFFLRPRKSIIVRLALVLTSALLGFTSDAQTKLFTGIGSWHDAARWSPSGVPTSTDIVLIAAGASITLSSNATCDSVYFQSGSTASTLTISNAVKLTINKGIAFSNPTANVTQLLNVGSGEVECLGLTMPDLTSGRVNKVTVSSGNVTLNGNLSMLGSTSENIIEYTSAGRFRLGGTWTTTGGTFTMGTSAFEYFANSTQAISSRTYNKLILSGGIKTPSGSVICNDSLIINAGATLNNSGTASLTMNGVFYIAGTYIEGSTSGSVTLVGLVHIATTGTFQVNVAEIFAIRGGIKNEGSFISGLGTYTFATNNQSISGPKLTTFSGGVTVTGITLTIEDSLSILGTLQGTGTLKNNTYLFLGGATNSITTLDLTATDNTVEYGRLGTQTVVKGSYKILLISGNNTKTTNGDLFIEDLFTINAGSTLSMSTFLLTLAGSCTLQGTGNLSTANTSTTPIPANINWPFTTITYNSASAQTIVTGAYNNLTSSSVARTLSSAGTISIAGTFTPGTGTYTSTGSKVVFNNAATQSIPGITGGYHKVILEGGIKNPSGTLQCNDSLIVSNGASLNNSGTANLTFNGVFYIAGQYIEGSTNGTVTLAGLIHITNTGTFQVNVAEIFSIRGGIRNEGNFISGSGTYTFSNNNQSIIGNTLMTFGGGLTVTGITLTNFDSIRINGSLTGTGTFSNQNYLLLMGATTSITTLDASAAGNTIVYGSASAQTVRAGSYRNLQITGAGTKTAGGALTVNENLLVASGSILAMGTNLLNAGASFSSSGSGTLSTTNTSATPITPDKNWSPTISYNSTSAQTIVSGNYTNLTSLNYARTLSSSGVIKVSEVFTPGTGTYTRTGSTIEFNGAGTQTIPIFTYNNLASSGSGNRVLPSGTITVQGNFNAGSNTYTTTGNTMVFNTATQGLSGTFNNLTLSTAGTKTALGNLTVDGTLSIAGGVTLNLTNQYTLGGGLTTINNSGTISTATPTGISTTPIATNKTWNGTIVFNGSANQTIPAGTYTNLSVVGTAVATAGGNLTVNGTLHLAQNPVENQGILETTISYSNYADVNNTNSTSIYNALNSYVLTMGPSAVTTGTGDVTGRIRRTTIVSGTTYSFGNTNTQLTFTGTSLPSQITVVATRGVNGLHVDKGNSVKRLYQVLRTGGNTPTTMNIRLAYDDTELNGNTEANMVLWDHHLPYAGITPHEHGKTNQNTDQNWVELTSHGVLYLAAEDDPTFTKYWMISNKESVDTTWLGAVPGGSWNIASNWSSGVIPANTAKIVVPNSANTPYDPLISGTVTVGTMEIKPGGIVEGGSGTLVLTGGPAINGGAGTWLNNGTFNAGTGTVVIDNADGTLAGTTTFNNLTINSTKKATLQTGTQLTINGTLTNNGTLDAGSNPNTITFAGTSQTVVNPNGTTPGFYNLVINGAGANLPTTLDVNGNLTMNTTVNFTGKTVRFRGLSNQNISASGNPTFNHVVINSGGEVTLNNTTTISGDLTFTNGKLNIGNQLITFGGNIINTVNNGIKSGGNAQIILSNNVTRTLSFDQSLPGTTNKIAFLTNNSISSTATIGNTLQITDEIVPTSGTINANGNLVLLSNATKTARIAQGTGTYITGTVKVQRYIPETARRWRFMSSPVTNATLEDWRQEIYITGPGTGNTIGTTNSNGYDATANNAAGVFYYNETITTGDLNTGWTVPTNTAYVLAPGRGYRLFIRGDRSDINRITNVNPTQNEVTMDVSGPVNTGDVVMPITFTSSGNINNDGWNLIGNPYPSSYDWKSFHQAGRVGNSGTYYTNIEPTIWVLDPTENTYKFYNTLANEGNLNNGIVAQGQGFWVKATGAGASITFKENYKTSAAPNYLFKSTEGGAFKIKLTRDSLNADEVLIKYITGSTKNYDAYDVLKLSSPIVISAWGTDSTHLSLSSRPLTLTNDTIRLYAYASTSGTYQMQFSNSNAIAVQDQVLLIDNYTNAIINLKQNNSYSFTINTSNSNSFGMNRFYIVVASNSALPVKLLSFKATKKQQQEVELSWATAIERNAYKFVVEVSTDGKNFEYITSIKAKGLSDELTNYSTHVTQTSDLAYYRLKQVDMDGSSTYSGIATINFNQEKEIIPEPITIYPVPAIDHIIVELANKHTIAIASLFDANGQMVSTQKVSATQLNLTIAHLPAGIYVLQLEDEYGELITRKFTKQ